MVCFEVVSKTSCKLIIKRDDFVALFLFASSTLLFAEIEYLVVLRALFYEGREN